MKAQLKGIWAWIYGPTTFPIPADYQVIEKRCTEDLEKEVCKLLNEGWSLAGGVAMRVHVDEDRVYYGYAQALYAPHKTIRL